ncbi:PDZ domain-containing protein [Blastococcus sp. MG754427]|uniref:PDZ domain-containing protein n=1 Tax=unclassified Blastococcus TaxID=2619396 RepID=UPI0035ABC7A9
MSAWSRSTREARPTRPVRPGDIVVSINGTATPSLQVLGAVLADLQVGETVTVTVISGGDERRLQVTLGKL